VRVLSAHKKPINCVAFSPDGTQLAEAAHGGRVRVWDLSSGTVAHKDVVYGMFPNQVRLAFAPDGKSLAATNDDIEFIGLTVVHGKSIHGDGKAFFGVAYFPDGKSVVGVGDKYGRYSPITGGAFPRLKLPAPRGCPCTWPACALTRDGTRLAISRRTWGVGNRGENSEAVFVYDTVANAVVAEFEWTGHPGNRLALAPDGSLVAAACGPVLRVWDVDRKALVAEKQVGKLHFMGLSFSADGRYVATVSKDRTTRFWEVGAWGEPKTFEWNVGQLLDVAFAPDGTTAAVSSDKGQIVLFDVD
jgi:WD40 repeat protein